MTIILLTMFLWLVGENLLVDEDVLGERYLKLWNQWLQDTGFDLE